MRARGPRFDTDEVKAAGQVPLVMRGQPGSCGPDQALALARPHRFQSAAQAARTARFDFHENKSVAFPADKVKFQRAAAPVAGQDAHAARMQQCGGGLLPGTAQGGPGIPARTVVPCR